MRVSLIVSPWGPIGKYGERGVVTLRSVEVEGDSEIDNGRVDKWLSVQNVADDLELNATTIRRMIKKGDLPAYKIGGEYRIMKREYSEWLLKQRVTPEET